MCDDLDSTVAHLAQNGIELARPITEEDWGRVTATRLAGGSELGLYQPKHLTAIGLP